MEKRVPPAVGFDHVCRVVFAVRPCELPVCVSVPETISMFVCHTFWYFL